MKRQVKFRGKRVDTEVWIYGSYHPHNDVMLCIASKEEVESNRKSLIIMDGMSDWNLTVPIHYLEVIPESVGEFTGLKDKNGKEIYEGDIISRLRHKESSNWASPMIHKKEFIRVVKYELGMFVGDDNSCPLKNDCKFNNPILEDYEVIGNVYENPELLK